jgi:catabolite regulation protein CreA
MKFACAAILSLVLVASALAGPAKTVGQVTFTCEVTGSDKDGFTIYAMNDGKTDKLCSASCTLTTANKGKMTWKAPDSGTRTVSARPGTRQNFGSGPLTGPAQPSPKLGTLSNPDLSDASCN